MLVIAHRGYHAKFIENTLAAFEAAVVPGVDGIETDVRISRDESIVLIHDRVVSGKAVVDLTHRELEQAIGYRVPTLDETLERFPGIMWNVEIKTTEALELVIGVLEKHQTDCCILVTSFRHDVVAVCASALKVDCGLLVSTKSGPGTCRLFFGTPLHTWFRSLSASSPSIAEMSVILPPVCFLNSPSHI